jgi:dipeptidyl aminopeptidase/acylaminoacyl peptidase
MELRGNHELTQKLNEFNLPKKTFITIPIGNGEGIRDNDIVAKHLLILSLVMNGYMILPPDFDPKGTYPLLMNVYGGPASQVFKFPFP